MRLSSTFLAAAALLMPSALALNPNNCNTQEKARTGADFALVEQADNPNVASLAKKLKRVTVADVFNDGNHKMMTDSAGRKLWEKKTGFDDLGTEKWVPQGISSTADAHEDGKYEGKDGWIVSWHRKDDKSARVTFVDRANDKYRHALLAASCGTETSCGSWTPRMASASLTWPTSGRSDRATPSANPETSTRQQDTNTLFLKSGQ
jgi:hypothetical protein